MDNLYIHFPFCRNKCSYCALHSRGGAHSSLLEDYAKKIAVALERAEFGTLKTVYFGGGSPALVPLRRILKALEDHISRDGSGEWTVELHPLDVSGALLEELRDAGVNRISMGLQSVDDDILCSMKRGYDFSTAEKAFSQIKKVFDNAGIDLIVGYPGEERALSPRHARLKNWGLRHCSAYSLILEEHSLLGREYRQGKLQLVDDDTLMDRVHIISQFLQSIGLQRYEISSYAAPGCECRHNLAVWSGEDYYGLGEGAHGRIGLLRTRNLMDFDFSRQISSSSPLMPAIEKVDADFDKKERFLFQLRTNRGIDETQLSSQNAAVVNDCISKGLLYRKGTERLCLTERGMEVCDSIMAELL